MKPNAIILSSNDKIKVTYKDYVAVQRQSNYLFNQMTQISCCGYYVYDYYKNNFLFLSKNMTYWSGHTIKEIKELGTDLFLQYVPQDELTYLKDVHEAGLRKFELFSKTERSKYSFSYDFHLLINGVKMMVNKQLTPYQLINGKIWMVLCKITLSANKTIGNVIIKKIGNQNFYKYDLKSHVWIYEKLPILTEVEKNMLRLIVQGYSSNEISEMLFYSEQTIKTYRKILKRKLNVENFSEAVIYVMNNGLFII